MSVEQTSISLRPGGGSGGLRNSRFLGPCFEKSSSSTSSTSAAAGSQLFCSHGSTLSLSFKNLNKSLKNPDKKAAIMTVLAVAKMTKAKAEAAEKRRSTDEEFELQISAKDAFGSEYFRKDPCLAILNGNMVELSEIARSSFSSGELGEETSTRDDSSM